MASTGKCEYCGSTIRSDEKECPNCGAANPNYVQDTPKTVFLPKTIDELKEYCAERGMPLLRMRFFIGEDYRQPRAFGIYRDGDQFVVYKNKSDGSRAVRYHGPDEAYAVKELYLKLLDECHKRGIYPDGKPAPGSYAAKRQKSRDRSKLGLHIFMAAMFLFFAFIIFMAVRSHKGDGYYRFSSDRMYYRYGNHWYYENDGGTDWTRTISDPIVISGDYDDYYLGNSFDSDWDVTNFKSSSAWEDIQERNSSSSSDYDSWDSGDTDWDSDW